MRRIFRVRVAAIFGVLLGLAVTGCGDDAEDNALKRGDRAWANGERNQALAEYRLAVRRSRGDGETLLRVAHTYASLGRVDEAREAYRQAVRYDESLADQAVSDLIHVAREAVKRNDNFTLSSAVDGASELRPGISAPDLALPLARHYYRSGQYGQSVPHFQVALGKAVDEPVIYYELAMAHEQIGDCRRALVFFERFREAVPAGDRRDTDWHIGQCSYELARETRRDGGSREEALELLQATINLGEPRNLVSQAWFDQGEILVEMEECDAAIEAFRRVVADGAASRVMLERAQQRIEELRFGSGARAVSLGGC